jgi:tetratricopeptide (TPR) repeat protein
VTAAPLPVLGALADKSLLRKDGARLVLHPLVQQFAALRLDERKDRDATQAAHAAYFLRMLVQLRGLLAVGDRTALQQVEDDFDNCRSAWAWALEQPKSDDARRCGKALLDFCDFRSRLAECLALFAAAVESPLARADAAFGALARSQLAQVLFRLDRYPEAESHARRALDEARKGDRESRWQAFKVLATCALRAGRLAEARDYFHKALEATPAETQAVARATTLDHLALVEKGMGRFDEALRLGLQALAQHRELGNAGAESLCLSNLGSLQLARREYAAAAGYLKAALAICEREGIVSTLQYVLSNLTEVSLHLNDLAAAENFARRALDTARAADHRALVGSATLNLARIALRRQSEEAAWARLGEGASTVLPLGIPILKFDVLACFAELLQSRGEVGCARQVLAFAANHPAATPGVRTELQRLLDEVPADDVEVAPWPGLELDDMLRRIVAESPAGCVHLIAALRGAH